MWQLIGSAIAGLVILLSMPVYNEIQANNLAATVDADAASQFQTILSGAQKYVAAQKDTLSDTLGIGGAYQEVPFVDLLNTNSLPGGFSQNNVLGATWHVYVQQPASGAIRTMVTATGGRQLKQSDLINIAGLTGDQGGYVPYDGMFGLSSSEAHGTTWNLSLAGLPSPGAGHLFGTVTIGDAASPTIDTNDFLYRVGVPGHDELNTMGVALNMGNNNINNVATLNANQGMFSNNVTVTAGGCAFNAPGTCVYGDGTNSAVRTRGTVFFQHMDGSGADTSANHATMQAAITGTDNGTAVSGGACSPNGAFASSTDGTGTHLECVSGIWKTFGGGGSGMVSYVTYVDGKDGLLTGRGCNAQKEEVPTTGAVASRYTMRTSGNLILSGTSSTACRVKQAGPGIQNVAISFATPDNSTSTGSGAQSCPSGSVPYTINGYPSTEQRSYRPGVADTYTEGFYLVGCFAN
mgnify:FL=1